MPKLIWAGDDEDILTADDIESAEESYTQYTGDIPPGGVYRFKIKRAKYTEFGTGSQGLNVLMELDGSWKPAHKKYDGCTFWDRIVMTKAAAAFVKAFAAGVGVSASDLVSRVIVDEDAVVTKIGKKSLDGTIVYVAVKRGMYEGSERLEKAGTGYQVVESDDDDGDDEESAPPPKKSSKAAPAKAVKATKAGKGKNKSKSDDDEPPF